MQVFVEPRGHSVFHCSPRRVARESRAEPFCEAGCASTVILWCPTELSKAGARSHAAHRGFPESRVLPMLPIGMLVLSRRNCRRCNGQRKSNKENQLGNPSHTRNSAIRLPFQRLRT
jgi:hypothetical protein